MRIVSLLGVAEAIAGFFDNIVYWFYRFLFNVVMWLKDIFDFCYTLVRRLAGIDTYYYNGTHIDPADPSGDVVTGDIIELLLRTDVIRNLFITLLVLGIILLFIVTFIAVWKTEWEFGKEGNSKSKVINAALKALFNFIAVPVITFFGIFVGNALLRAIDSATAGGEDVTLSSMVMGSMMTNAVRSDLEGKAGNSDFIELNLQEKDGKKGIFLYFANSRGEINSQEIISAFKNKIKITSKDYQVFVPEEGPLSDLDVSDINKQLENGELVLSFDSNHLFGNKDIIEVFFDVREVNYLLAYIVLIIMLKSILEITYGLVKRFFYLIFLFLVSPPVVAMAPVNDKILGEWRKLFIKYACMAYVTLGVYNVFLSIFPLFDNLSFFGGVYGILDSFTSLLIVCVGLLTVNEISKVLSNLFGFADVHDESVDKDGSLWGKAFGMAGKAFKPMDLALKGVGKAIQYGNTWHKKGFKAAADQFGNDLDKTTANVATTMATAGPLKDLWENMGEMKVDKKTGEKQYTGVLTPLMDAHEENKKMEGTEETLSEAQEAEKGNIDNAIEAYNGANAKNQTSFEDVYKGIFKGGFDKELTSNSNASKELQQEIQETEQLNLANNGKYQGKLNNLRQKQADLEEKRGDLENKKSAAEEFMKTNEGMKEHFENYDLYGKRASRTLLNRAAAGDTLSEEDKERLKDLEGKMSKTTGRSDAQNQVAQELEEEYKNVLKEIKGTANSTQEQQLDVISKNIGILMKELGEQKRYTGDLSRLKADISKLLNKK